MNPLITKSSIDESLEFSEAYLTNPRTLQFWGSALVVLPVFLQAPWVHLYPIAACLFSIVLVGVGVSLANIEGGKWSNAGSLLIGVSASWLCGCLFWGWLRAQPIWHLPVEAIFLPFAFLALSTRWRIGAAFYLASLLGTAFTDLMMVLTGVMRTWPLIVEAPLSKASQLLNEAAQELVNPTSVILLLIAAISIILISNFMRQRSLEKSLSKNAWLIASAALTTTLWVDGLFLLTAFVQPRLSGLI